jgi:hypothetical protein
MFEVTALEGEDYLEQTGSRILGPGVISTTISVPIVGDTITESNEIFVVNLTSPIGATISDGQGIGTITNDEIAGDAPTVQFTALQRNVSEESGSIIVQVTRSGDLSAAATVEYATSSQASASERGDYTSALGRLSFAAGESSKTFTVFITDDVFVEGNEFFLVTLSNATGAALGSPVNGIIRILDNDISPPPSNPVDQTPFFVRQHYIDFLNREPDPAGFAFWTGEIDNCTPKPQCTEIKRINVSAAFFLSIEFQQTGYLVERLYKSSYGDAVGTSTIGGTHQLPVPIVQINEFLPDTQEIGRGFVVGAPGADLVLENNKQAFIGGFVQRSRFTTAYPTTLTPTQFVDALFTNTGVTPSASERTAAIDEFGGAGTSADAAARARALRRVAENGTFTLQETNKAFVLMEYFGYMRRSPNSAPDSDHSGYEFWLTKLNQFGGNFIDAEMVKAFIISGEYRVRFGH